MNPVAMNIINPRKKYWPSRGSNRRPPVLKSAKLPTKLWSSASNVERSIEYMHSFVGYGNESNSNYWRNDNCLAENRQLSIQPTALNIFVAFVEDNVTISSIRYLENHVTYFVKNLRK